MTSATAFLKKKAKEIASQNNRSTQYPLFIIMEKREAAVPEGVGETKHRPNLDYGFFLTEEACENCIKENAHYLSSPYS